jgi:hypothetical protein
VDIVEWAAGRSQKLAQFRLTRFSNPFSGQREPDEPMNPQIETALLSASISALVALAGWFANHNLTIRREGEARRQQASLKFLERQIEELYGPLLGLLDQGEAVFAVAHQRRDKGDPDADKAWRYFTETYFLPLNAQMVALLRSKVHLMEGRKWPESYLSFFRHQAQFEGLHNLWAEEGVSSLNVQGAPWPSQFGLDARSTVDRLKARHSTALTRLGVL